MNSKTLSVFAVAGLAGVANASLLSNGSFESDISFMDAMPMMGNWTAFFGPTAQTIEQNTASPDDGMRHMVFGLGGDNGFTGVQQAIDAAAGQTYTFSIRARTGAPVAATDVLEFRMEFRDAAGNLLDVNGDGNIDFGDNSFYNNQLKAELTGQYQTFSSTVVAPAGTGQINAVIALQSFDGGGFGIPVFVDTAMLVPAPGAVALLGLAGMGLRRRR